MPQPQITSFATFLILCSTAFFLGILFSSFPYDFPLLWTSSPTTPEFYDLLEAHLTFVTAAPPLIIRILHIVVAVGFLGFLIKLWYATEANLLFDGASLVLYFAGMIMYSQNIVRGRQHVSTRSYNMGDTPVSPEEEAAGKVEDMSALGREDTMKVLAASNTILALVLVGVLILQAGLWYAERKEAEEIEQFEKEELAAKAAALSTTGKSAAVTTGKSKGDKKKQ